jgi:hypothetical protein
MLYRKKGSNEQLICKTQTNGDLKKKYNAYIAPFKLLEILRRSLGSAFLSEYFIAFLIFPMSDL